MFPASSSSRPHQAYVRALSRKGPGDYQMEFYSVPINHDVSGGGEDGTVRALTPIKVAKVPLHGGFAAVDNKLYCIGGDPPSKRHSTPCCSGFMTANFMHMTWLTNDPTQCV
ncbi:hypothetical protein RHMOL_Rhmol07G0295800 [Rhododendron molle]|uniref:Uncharacterized protein n=1 Tax=Rhododendron molle TaxID=49168 RepID=A0ACC0N800_RHOML|nr:hypothetical protein RHMOL_Rhmol07G0295800 [Rhododendron molle]